MRVFQQTLVTGAIGLSLLATTRARCADIEVVIHHFAFTPASLTIFAGDTVRWTNLDSMEHTVTSQTGAGTLIPSGLFDSGLMQRDDTFSVTFHTPGTYHYYCQPHGSSMQGRVIVVPPPCGTSDFDGDLDFGTDADIEAFFACLAGGCCPNCWHLGSDFDADGDAGTDADIESFFRVLAGAVC